MSPLERQLHLPARLTSVTRARHFVRDLLVGWDLGSLVEDDQLGTSELVANAIRHAGTDLVLTVRVDGLITISIQDGQPELRRPVVADSDFLAENGRGLHIVAAIARDWGITTAANGKVVWFNLALPDAAGDDADVLSMSRKRHVPAAAGEEMRDDDVQGVGEQVESAG